MSKRLLFDVGVLFFIIFAFVYITDNLVTDGKDGIAEYDYGYPKASHLICTILVTLCICGCIWLFSEIAFEHGNRENLK